MIINYPLLIDGGLSNLLEKNGFDLNHNLWTAKLLEHDQDALINAHYTYLKSGARCIITSSYQATIDGFLDLGYDMVLAEKLLLKSVAIAKKAVERFDSNDFTPLVGMSIGPYGAYLADGSEYYGNYEVSDDILYDFHIKRIRLLDSTSADFFACETIPSFREAKILSKILRYTNKPAWISFACKDHFSINDGTNIEECVSYLANHPNIFALGLNCTHPRYINHLIRLIKKQSLDKRIVVYPNSGESYDVSSKKWTSTSDIDLFTDMAKEWIDLGVDIIGGCCRVGPSHISSLSRMIYC